MKPGNVYMILFIALLVMPGCGRKDRNKPPEREKLSSVQTIDSRFADYGITYQHKYPEKLEAKDTSAYYLPDYPIESVSSIASDFQFNKINIKKTFNLKSSISSTRVTFLEAGTTSPNAYFTAIFDNDIFDYTDYYFTNGAGFEFYHPVLSASPITRILPGLKYGVNYYGLSLIQNLYTPLKLNKPEILVGDRPFAAYLVLGHHRVSLSPEKRQRLHSEFTLGVIGPGSLGNFSQAMIHSEEPIGWKYQVENDFVINYSIRFDQGLFSGKGIEIAAVAGGQAGTLYDNLTGGLFLQVGRANDRYSSIFQTTEQQIPFRKRMRYYFSLDITNKLIVYDATLQGGMFNKESIYTIDNEDIKRYVFTGTAVLGIGFGKYSLEASQVFLTPEFEGGRHHLWFRIRNIIQIN